MQTVVYICGLFLAYAIGRSLGRRAGVQEGLRRAGYALALQVASHALYGDDTAIDRDPAGDPRYPLIPPLPGWVAKQCAELAARFYAEAGDWNLAPWALQAPKGTGGP